MSDGYEDDWDNYDHSNNVEGDPAQRIGGVHDQVQQEPVEIMEVDAELMEEQGEAEIAGVHNEQEAEMAGVHRQVQENNDDDRALADCGNNEAQHQLENEMDAKYGRCSGHLDLRSRKECDYSHLFVTKYTQFNNDGSHANKHAN